MNEQEMQFANPDWQPPTLSSTQKSVAFYTEPTLPVEPQGSEWDTYHTYQQGYQAQQRPLVQYPTSPPLGIMGARRRLWPWLVMTVTLICLVPVLLSAMAMMVAKNSVPARENVPFMKEHHAFTGRNRIPSTGHTWPQLMPHSYSYDMTHISMVQIDDPTGFIHVHGSMSDTKSQIEALSDTSMPNPLQFLRGSDGTLTIKVNAPSDDDPVLLDIVLPQNMGLTLSTNGGNIEVDGINGQVNLHTASSILLSHDTISGQSNITSAQGNVRIVNSTLNGTYTVSGNRGPIALQQVSLSGQGHIQAQEEASILLIGIVDPQGSYTFTSEQGEIDLALPSDTPLRLHLNPGAGNVSSDFSTQTNSGATLTATSASGNILIRKEP